MAKMNIKLLLALAAGLLLAGCGARELTVQDAGVVGGDVLVDSGAVTDLGARDAGERADSSTDAGMDGGVDAEADIGAYDGGADVGTDVGADAEVADTGEDATTDVGQDAGIEDTGNADTGAEDAGIGDTGATDSGYDGGTNPQIVSVYPPVGAADMPENTMVMVTFDRPMDPATINANTFTLVTGGAPVSGTVSYDGLTASFVPATDLTYSASYEATVTTGATSASGIPLETDFNSSFSIAPKPSWTKLIGTPGPDGSCCIAVDTDGNVFAVGMTQDELDGNVNRGYIDGFVVKYNVDGAMDWARQFGSPQLDIPHSVALDADGNVYVAGETQGGVEMQSSLGGEDGFLVKYNNLGVFQWSRQVGTSEADLVYGLAAHPGGGVVVTGFTAGFMDGSGCVQYCNAFVARYDSEGNQTWVRQFGSDGGEKSRGVATDDAGNIYLVGETGGALDGNVYLGGGDAFIAKFNQVGDKQWVREFGTQNEDSADSIVMDHLGNLYVSGSTGGGLDGGGIPKYMQAFLAKFDVDGDRTWLIQARDPAPNILYACQSMAIDGEAGLYWAGYSIGNFDGNVGAGDTDALIMKFDTLGNRIWSRTIGGKLMYRSPPGDDATGVAVDTGGSIFVIGGTINSRLFDGIQTSPQGDAFVMKYSSDGVRQ